MSYHLDLKLIVEKGNDILLSENKPLNIQNQEEKFCLMSQLIVIVHMGQILNYQLIKYRISTTLELIVRIESKS